MCAASCWSFPIASWEREADALAFGYRELRPHRAATDLGRDAGADGDLVRAAEGAAALLGRTKERPDETDHLGCKRGLGRLGSISSR